VQLELPTQRGRILRKPGEIVLDAVVFPTLLAEHVLCIDDVDRGLRARLPQELGVQVVLGAHTLSFAPAFTHI
jgi:hypothetical protein